MTLTETRANLMKAVERLRPLIESNGLRAETERRLPDELYSAMFESGLFAMPAPRAYGGLELHPVEACASGKRSLGSTPPPPGTCS